MSNQKTTETVILVITALLAAAKTIIDYIGKMKM
jgi:hypothetical protein